MITSSTAELQLLTSLIKERKGVRTFNDSQESPNIDLTVTDQQLAGSYLCLKHSRYRSPSNIRPHIRLG